MIDTWVVVADGSHAHFYSTDAEMLEFESAREEKNKNHSGSHRGRQDEGAAHHSEEAAFAKDLANIVAHAVNAHEVQDVVLVAPAKFLSELHGALPASVAKHVKAKLNKDFTKLERHELAKRVKSALAE